MLHHSGSEAQLLHCCGNFEKRSENHRVIKNTSFGRTDPNQKKKSQTLRCTNLFIVVVWGKKELPQQHQTSTLVQFITRETNVAAAVVEDYHPYKWYSLHSFILCTLEVGSVPTGDEPCSIRRNILTTDPA